MADGKRARQVSHARWSAVLYLAPALLVFAMFVGYPILQTLRYSQFDWDGISAERSTVGFDNFSYLLNEDPYFWRALRNNLLWGLGSVAASIAIGFTLASVLDVKLRGRAIYRSIFFLPAVMSPVVIAAVWGRIYNPQAGLANQLLDLIGVDGKSWLGEPNLALASTMLVAVWRWSGLFMLFYLAGLQTISNDILEASRLDGANYFQTVRLILLPMLKPTTALLILLGTIAAMREFEIIAILTGGGPAHATDLLSTRIFAEAFELFNAGTAAAISVVLLGVTAVLAVVELRYLARVNREQP
jgi:raffinose/stachyose/melibiose transport system permease protein